MSNHFGSFWLESYPLFAVYFAAKPPLPRRGLLRFACAGRVPELRKQSSKSSIAGQHALPFLKKSTKIKSWMPLQPAEQSTSCLSQRWWCRWPILTFASTRLHRLPSIKTVLCCFIVWKPCLIDFDFILDKSTRTLFAALQTVQAQTREQLTVLSQETA